VYGIFRPIHAGKYGIIHTSSTTKAFSMALIPSFETILLEIHQSLGLERPQSRYISEFSDLGLSLETHQKMAEKLLAEIFSALEMDPQAKHDASYNMLQWAGFHKALELNTWTGNASDKQVLWHLLAYAYVPGMARHLAFWSLDGMQRQQPFDAGMPGGEFWFLPHWDTENNTLQLPVPQVIDWLLDLLDVPSLQRLNTELGRKKIRENGGDDAVVSTLQNWRNDTKPQSSKKIEQHFPDDAALNFAGTFSIDESLTSEAQFQAALALVLGKGLNAKTLRDQIPMTVERLESIVNGGASEKEKQEFVRLIALRYAKPSVQTIRQRLRIARMAQDGYERLLKTLCGDVEATCTDPAQNKLLQLLALFQNIYNLTIAAWQSADTAEEEDAWFEARLAPWDKADLLLSIVPSQKKTAYLTLAERLTRKFMLLEQDSPLEDLVPLGDGGANAEAVVKRRVLSLQQEHEEDLRLMALIDKVRRSSPWRALEAETSYWILSQFAHEKAISPNARSMAIKRMRDVAETPGQAVQAIMLELHFLMNDEPKQWPKDIQRRVQLLLDEAQASQGYEEWKAPLLRLRAKHRLMQNDCKGACKDFKAALEACSERSFGGVRGEIARDGWATEIVVNSFISNNQEVYYRNMLGYNMFPDGMVSFEDAATSCEEFFWSDLYHPYPGFESKKQQMTPKFTAAFQETLGLIFKADFEGLQRWLKQHGGKLQNDKFHDARRDSLLLRWMKMQSDFQKKLPALKMMTPTNMAGEFLKMENGIHNWRKAIGLLIEAWPKQAKIADFKGQTPLMLAADNGDAELTRLLAPLSNVDAQDYEGRTALHSAMSGRSPECVAIVLNRYSEDDKADVEKATKDEGNTALHTAVRFGQLDCVRLIIEEFPGLVSKANIPGQTPLDMAKDILEHLPVWQEFMRNKKNRRTGSKEDFEAIIVLLERKAA
jgi:hypothetical protein